jgi:hypothetical protein
MDCQLDPELAIKSLLLLLYMGVFVCRLIGQKLTNKKVLCTGMVLEITKLLMPSSCTYSRSKLRFSQSDLCFPPFF